MLPRHERGGQAKLRYILGFDAVESGGGGGGNSSYQSITFGG